VKCCNPGKLRHTWKNVPHLEKCPKIEKKCGKLGKMSHTCEKCRTVGKMRHTWKNAQRLVKCTSLGKMP